MYEANVDDVGYRLVAIYTPVREDGVEGQPISVSTEPIAVGTVNDELPYRFLFMCSYCSILQLHLFDILMIMC
jgi:hypothetical protein